MNTKEKLASARRFINHLKKVYWPPMSYMAIPSLLKSADECIAELEQLPTENLEVQSILKELQLHRTYFKRVTDYWEKSQSNFTLPFPISIDQHFPSQLDQGIRGFKEAHGFYPMKVILHPESFQAMNDAFVAWGWHKLGYADQPTNGITLCFNWVGAEHGETSSEVRLTGIATADYWVHFICYANEHMSEARNMAIAARNDLPEPGETGSLLDQQFMRK